MVAGAVSTVNRLRPADDRTARRRRPTRSDTTALPGRGDLRRAKFLGQFWRQVALVGQPGQDATRGEDLEDDVGRHGYRAGRSGGVIAPTARQIQ